MFYAAFQQMTQNSRDYVQVRRMEGLAKYISLRPLCSFNHLQWNTAMVKKFFQPLPAIIPKIYPTSDASSWSFSRRQKKTLMCLFNIRFELVKCNYSDHRFSTTTQKVKRTSETSTHSSFDEMKAVDSSLTTASGHFFLWPHPTRSSSNMKMTPRCQEDQNVTPDWKPDLWIGAN